MPSNEELRTLKPGDRVRVRDDHGNEADYEVRMEPWELYGHEWVVGLKGICGGYLLSRVVKILERNMWPLCALCRRPHKDLDRSACVKCVPPDEGEIIARSTVKKLEQEVRMYQQSCDEHIRIRNEQGQRIKRWRDEIRMARDLVQTGNVIAGLRRLEMLLGES